MAKVIGSTPDPSVPGVFGENTNTTNTAGVGVHGKSRAAGVLGESETWHGVVGLSKGGFGVYGEAPGAGVVGKSKNWHGVVGSSEDTTHGGFGVFGEAIGTGPGVVGASKAWHGVYGETHSTKGGAGVWGEHKGDGSGVVGISASGVGVHAKGGKLAGLFEGNLEITGHILHHGDFDCHGDMRFPNADCAEEFGVAGGLSIEPGTVMVLGEEDALSPSQCAYDKRVAGVVSGAGAYKPAILLDKQPGRSNRQPIALLGKVYCKVDASHEPIEVGDLLTTAPTPGHAMKASDPLKAFGAVIGKALRPLKAGQGLIPILIALR